ncbi:MAG: hypothetical protein MRECE_23c017 [Mycoplasmataceae bacterium CE_OT135]|nr:MAG: hypothetical protein MRECE_23c017 [Mycoplasmataceae bacterium CE_OT135]
MNSFKTNQQRHIYIFTFSVNQNEIKLTPRHKK